MTNLEKLRAKIKERGVTNFSFSNYDMLLGKEKYDIEKWASDALYMLEQLEKGNFRPLTASDCGESDENSQRPA